MPGSILGKDETLTQRRERFVDRWQFLNALFNLSDNQQQSTAGRAARLKTRSALANAAIKALHEVSERFAIELLTIMYGLRSESEDVT